MTNLIKNTVIGLIIFCFLISGTACSRLIDRSGERQSRQNNVFDLPNDNQEDDATLAGIWRGTAQFQSFDCQREYVFQPNGKYSATMDCGPYKNWITGDWRIIQPGTMRLDIANYEPKEYAGRKVYMPDGETVSYRFINSNQLRMDSATVIEGAVISDLYRAQ